MQTKIAQRSKPFVIIAFIIIVVLTSSFSTVYGFSASDVKNMSDEKIEVANTIGNFLINDLGLTEAAALGVLGNIGAECAFNPGIVEGGYTETDGGIGICQWTNSPRNSASPNARNNRLRARLPNWRDDLEGQLEYLKWELEGGYNYILEDLLELGNTEQDIEEASYIWCKWFERPQDPHGDGYITLGKKDRAEIGKELAKILDFQISGKSKDFSLQGTLLTPTMHLTLTDGSVFTTLEKEKQDRAELNTAIYDSTVGGVSTNGKTYSLYNRFGPKLQFVEYLGEETIDLELVDHIVSKSYYLDEKITLEDIMYNSTVYLSNNVYRKRPGVLTSSMVANGYTDPRVSLYMEDHFGTLYTVTHAKILLAVSQFGVSIVNWLISEGPFKLVSEMVNKVLESSLWEKVFTPVIYFLLGLAVIGIIVSIVKYANKYSKGQAAIGQVIQRILVSILAMGIIAVSLSQPTNINNILTKGTTIIHDIFEYGLNESRPNDEVIYSTDGENALEAALWKKSLFEPWCFGVFGYDENGERYTYEKLYTQLSDKDASSKFPQSYNPDHKNPISTDSEGIFYDSASLTGDVVVDVGNGKQIRNWAAYAWSTQSIYHIDQQIYEKKTKVKPADEQTEEAQEEKNTVWPNALTTAEDKNIYADAFRWIDAKMNISPQYKNEAGYKDIPNYADSRPFETHYYKAGLSMVWRTLLLCVMIPVLLKRLYAFLHIFLLVFEFIFYSLYEIAKENAGLSVIWVKLKKYFADYFYTSLQVYLMISIYLTLVGDNFLLEVMYIILSYVIMTVTPRDIIKRIQRTKRNVQRVVTGAN